jgi:uncharacterized protein
MIIYQSNKQEFIDNVFTNRIDEIIGDRYFEKLGKKFGASEMRSFRNSLGFMDRILSDKDIPDDCGISIEYNIPQTSKRIDFIITGQDAHGKENAILVELKQWDKIALTEKDGLVNTRFEHGPADTSHPSYQVWSYAMLLESFNEAVYQNDIQLKPCAYLHNYKQDGIIDNPFYQDYIDKAPIFLKDDAQKLRDFIKSFVKFGDKKDILYKIDNGKIKPSKSLADSIVKMLKKNDEFVMIDDQKIVYENILAITRKNTNKKHVIIVQGGPGTGKSVVAVNLLATTRDGLNVRYISKNSAPRDVFASKLTGTMKKTHISNMFSGSGSFTDIDKHKDLFDLLIVDEAHRLNAKSGMFSNKGENQVKEIIEASKTSVFFIDEDQRVTFKDIGSKQEIINWAIKNDADILELELSSQFRCNGSDGYLAWLDNVLEIKETANLEFDVDYDFKVLDTPEQVRDMIFEKNKINNKARLVAGYCWDWKSKKDKTVSDIVIGDFGIRWNLAADGSLWIIAPESVTEVGCIHTCQGLEVDYVGVIVGDDFVIRNGKVVTQPNKRAKTDKSLHGYKKLRVYDEKMADTKADLIIKNTYRTLMTRGMKGCYVYFTDKETREWFKGKNK